MIKVVKESGLPKDPLGRTAYDMSIDVYRTFAPLKQTTSTIAIACVELSTRLLNMSTEFNMDAIVGPQGTSLEKWSTDRGMVMGTFHRSLNLMA
ncbi:MAG: hypothetical protein EOO38_32155 [Cytophagaceae bacterium]|nr:MAG: hypothetical protein EOO38_32155 [Cytophagaceae bacterium]